MAERRVSTSAVKFKIMPSGLDINLSELLPKIKKGIESFPSGVFNGSEEEPIAFGLKALIVTFALSEAQEVDLVQNALGEIDGVSSVEMLDYRRAIG